MPAEACSSSLPPTFSFFASRFRSFKTFHRWCAPTLFFRQSESWRGIRPLTFASGHFWSLWITRSILNLDLLQVPNPEGLWDFFSPILVIFFFFLLWTASGTLGSSFLPSCASVRIWSSLELLSVLGLQAWSFRFPLSFSYVPKLGLLCRWVLLPQSPSFLFWLGFEASPFRPFLFSIGVDIYWNQLSWRFLVVCFCGFSYLLCYLPP